ncbi:unnamed protein product [Symbiodinium pilosum]|uniref:Uncharacterized protein n=1 Tax=Symbiodinium pilosum TaxID=2952 RepID=A0A812VLR4_SYMPI|nr:unnamed protein product [Symbiodinium pilosum]
MVDGADRDKALEIVTRHPGILAAGPDVKDNMVQADVASNAINAAPRKGGGGHTVPIAGEVISRRPKGAASRAHYKATHKDEAEDVSRDLQKIVRLDGPAKINWLCKALPLLRRRAMTAAQFLDIVCNQRFAANVDDVMPWGTQMISMLRRELDDLQPQQVHHLQQSDLWRRFADSDDERAVVAATTSSAPGRAAAFRAAVAADKDKSSSAFTMGCGASARVSAHVGHRLSFRHPSDEKRPQARKNPESYRTRIVTMLTTEDGDLEVQLSSKSQPERAEKKKVTFQFLEDADEDVDFAEEIPRKRVTFALVVDTHFFKDEDTIPARPMQVSVAWEEPRLLGRAEVPRVPNQPESDDLEEMHPFYQGLRELPVMCTECTDL